MSYFISPHHGALMRTFIRTRDINRKGINSKLNKLQGDKAGQVGAISDPAKKLPLAKFCTTSPGMAYPEVAIMMCKKPWERRLARQLHCVGGREEDESQVQALKKTMSGRISM